MKKYSTILLTLILPLLISAQTIKQENLSIAVFTAGNGMPFTEFDDLLTGPYHPGIEIGKGFNWSTKRKHDWFQNFKISYFYHRFVQHAIPLNTEFGYRYKINKAFSPHASLGLGYLHAIPATGVYKLDNEGTYKNSKGIGRPQANVSFAIGVGFIPQPESARQMKVFIEYRERLQFPFVKSYVPMLPYKDILLGVSVLLMKANNKPA